MPHILSGACHCGNIRMDLHTQKKADELVPRECSCSFCRKHQASWISDPEGSVHIRYVDAKRVSPYRFGTKTADFIVCAYCGVLMVTTCEIEGRLRAVLNIRAMADVAFAPPVTTDFDGEDVQSRLARRARNWTGSVVFE